jgi:tRNA dimethylallyltransferase
VNATPTTVDMEESPPLILVGPTAVGKTDVAMELADRCGGEIVNADSMQVYIGMDIGTAKPTATDRRRATFHLLDIVHPDDPYSVSEWKRQAEEAVAAITARGHLPILCGGTGLYIRAFVDDWSLAATPADPHIRGKLQALAEQLGSAALHAQLACSDPVTAARLHPNDTIRIIRALEVKLVTGTPISEFQDQDRRGRRTRHVMQFGLTMPRPELYARIDRRVEQMMAQGLESEVETLLARGFSPELPAMRSLGYKEMCAHLRGGIDRQTTSETIKLNTRRFSKRQQTWFRADPRIGWIDVTAITSATAAQRIIELFAVGRTSTR